MFSAIYVRLYTKWTLTFLPLDRKRLLVLSKQSKVINVTSRKIFKGRNLCDDYMKPVPTSIHRPIQGNVFRTVQLEMTFP